MQQFYSGCVKAIDNGFEFLSTCTGTTFASGTMETTGVDEPSTTCTFD